MIQSLGNAAASKTSSLIMSSREAAYKYYDSYERLIGGRWVSWTKWTGDDWIWWISAIVSVAGHVVSIRFHQLLCIEVIYLCCSGNLYVYQKNAMWCLFWISRAVSLGQTWPRCVQKNNFCILSISNISCTQHHGSIWKQKLSIGHQDHGLRHPVHRPISLER